MFLLSIYQILTIYSINTNEVSFSTMLIITLFSFIFSGVVFFILSIKLNYGMAGIITSLFIFSFFVYGRILNFFISFEIPGLLLNRNKYLLPIFILILISLTFFILRNNKFKNNLLNITYLFNQFSAGLLIFVIIFAAFDYDWTKLSKNNDYVFEKTELKNKQVNRPSHLSGKPNVYWLIFDSYPNKNVLNKYYKWDNSKFLKSLEDKNFIIDNYARSNYCFTGASIASTLNMRYIHLDTAFNQARNQDTYISMFYKNNFVMNRFKANGYEVVTNLNNKNINIINNKKSLLSNDFTQLVIHVSILRIFENELITNQLRNETLALINGLINYNRSEKPTFFAVHFMLPHSPFIFNADGSRPKYFESAFAKFEHKEKFIEQVRYSEKKIIEIVDSIKKKDNNSLIIIQADHGFGGDDDFKYLNRNSTAAKNNSKDKPPSGYIGQRFGILSAIFSPYELNIPKKSSPVNLFRHIFNKIFNDDNLYLPDESYFTTIKQPYFFHNVTEDINNSYEK